LSQTELLDLKDIILTLCRNISLHPEDQKFRIIKQSNKVVQQRIVPRKGGLEFLGAIGFIVEIIDGQKVLHFEGTDLSPADVSAVIEDGLAWLESTIETCLLMADIHDRQPSESCSGE
jgi:hypothetical protein